MALQTKYITLDEFDEYFPEINIRLALGGETNALAYLKRIEDRLQTFIDVNFHIQTDRLYPTFTDYQKYHYKRALLEQAIYIFKNSDLSVDSGFDTDRGVVADINTIQKVAIAPNTKQELVLCGLWSRHLKNYGFINMKEWLG